MKVNVGEPEAATDEAAIAEYFSHFFGRGVGGDIEILRIAPEQQVAYAAAGEIGGVYPASLSP